MSNLKTLTTITIATFLATPAFAQDAGSSIIIDPLLDPTAIDFVTADLDLDGRLNADEFITFVGMRAEAGEERYLDIVIGGEFKLAFKSYDADASGGVEIAELSLKADVEPKHEDSPGGHASDPNYPQ